MEFMQVNDDLTCAGKGSLVAISQNRMYCNGHQGN